MMAQGGAVLRTEAEKNGLIIDSKYRFPALEAIARALYDGGFTLFLGQERSSKMNGGIFVHQIAYVNFDDVELSIAVSGYAKEASHE